MIRAVLIALFWSSALPVLGWSGPTGMASGDDLATTAKLRINLDSPSADPGSDSDLNDRPKPLGSGAVSVVMSAIARKVRLDAPPLPASTHLLLDLIRGDLGPRLRSSRDALRPPARSILRRC